MTERLHSHSESSGKWRSKKERNSKVEFVGLKIYRVRRKRKTGRSKHSENALNTVDGGDG